LDDQRAGGQREHRHLDGPPAGSALHRTGSPFSATLSLVSDFIQTPSVNERILPESSHQ
jgi:hypothetical protein